MAEFDYKQRPQTQEYRDNFDMIFRKSPIKPSSLCRPVISSSDAKRNKLIGRAVESLKTLSPSFGIRINV